MAGMELHMTTGEEIKVRLMSARKLDVKEDPTVDKNYLRRKSEIDERSARCSSCRTSRR
jgi:hypothetical protein